MRLRVIEATLISGDVRLIRMAAPDGSPLSAFDAGAHLIVDVPVRGGSVQRKYSLVSDTDGGNYYEIAVRRHPEGRGGSAFLHDNLPPGAFLDTSSPVSEFGIAPDGEHHVLLSGGIGITPMPGIVAQLGRSNASWEMHHSARTPATMILRDRFPQESSERIALYFTAGDQSRRIDVESLVAAHAASDTTHFYVCGPVALVDRVRLAADALGVPKRRVHFESFGPAWTASDKPVKLSLSESGVDLEVPVGTTLLDAMESAGAWLASDCRRGECGACIATYTSGSPIHRDYCLTEEQRTHSFCPCVSWASPGDVLTLQL